METSEDRLKSFYATLRNLDRLCDCDSLLLEDTRDMFDPDWGAATAVLWLNDRYAEL